MNKQRYDTDGQWFKGNLHLHTNVSDGQKNMAESAAAYAGAGYDFMAFTDHAGPGYEAEKLQNALKSIANDEWPLLIIPGAEFHGTDDQESSFHIVGLGDIGTPPIDEGITAVVNYCKQRDTLLVLAHPHLMYHSEDEVTRYNLNGVEVYNHLAVPCSRADSSFHLDQALHHDPNTLVLAVDDAHNCGEDARQSGGYTPWCGGWIMVNAATCTFDDIWANIKSGNFYATTGPDFMSIEVSDTEISILTSPIRRAWLIGAPWYGDCRIGQGDELFTELTFPVQPEWEYMRLVIEDEHGNRAWSNTLLTA